MRKVHIKRVFASYALLSHRARCVGENRAANLRVHRNILRQDLHGSEHAI
jgi:hypothetical protein